MVYLSKLHIFLFLTFVFCITNSESIGPQKHYSNKELLAINEFRPMVSKFLTMDFQKTDAYLLRWIRYNNFDLKAAAKGLEKHYKFRVEGELDSILESDGTGTQASLTPNLQKYLPYDINGHDKAGRPILYLAFGRWNIRKFILAGTPEIPRKHYEELFERLTRKAFKEGGTLGKDIDQFYVIADLNGYNLRQTGCLACLPVIASIARTAVAYAPFWVNGTVVNTPRIFNPALSIIKPIFGDKLPLNFYDFDKADWQKKILKEISLDQLPPTMQ